MLYSRKQLLVTLVHPADHTNVATGTLIKRTVIHGIPIEKEEVAVNVTLIDQLRHPKCSGGGGIHCMGCLSPKSRPLSRSPVGSLGVGERRCPDSTPWDTTISHAALTL